MDSSIFRHIEQRSLQQEVVDIIRQAIVSGKLDLGQHLTEASLSDQLAVSRIPIREALRQLEQEGLVTRYNNRGCFVIDFGEDDVREVFSLRAVLECMSIEWAAPRMVASDFIELRKLIADQGQSAQKHDFADLARLDMRFHEFICEKSNHSRLLKEWHMIQAQCQMLLNQRFLVLSDYTPASVVEDHLKILDAIERQDIAAAIRLTNEISSRVELECIQTLRSIKQQGLSD